MKAGGSVATALLVALVVFGGCSDKDEGRRGDPSGGAPTAMPGASGGTPIPETATAREILEAAQVAIDASGGYLITATQSNFVLPQWGGSDGGTVRVGPKGETAEALLNRTGEGGPYSIVLVDGQTFFKRATCDSWARIPGGGADVLRAFLLPMTKSLAKAAPTGEIISHSDSEVILMAWFGLGQTIMTVDARTGLPIRLDAADATRNARPLSWTFSEWGKAPSVSKPSNAPDRGPGGNPC